MESRYGLHIWWRPHLVARRCSGDKDYTRKGRVWVTHNDWSTEVCTIKKGLDTALEDLPSTDKEPVWTRHLNLAWCYNYYYDQWQHNPPTALISEKGIKAQFSCLSLHKSIDKLYFLVAQINRYVLYGMYLHSHSIGKFKWRMDGEGPLTDETCYSTSELGKSQVLLSGAFGGLLATGLVKIHSRGYDGDYPISWHPLMMGAMSCKGWVTDHWKGWLWIFFIKGAITVGFGQIFFFLNTVTPLYRRRLVLTRYLTS